MSKRIIIAVAPTGGWGKGRGNPVSPETIARDVIACANTGAAVVHLHARDENGNLSADLACFNQAVETIKASCDIIVEASTGGLSLLTAVERALPAAHPHADLASLNMGSLNFGDQVYCNALPDVRLWIDKMTAAGVKPSLEVFDTGTWKRPCTSSTRGSLLNPAISASSLMSAGACPMTRCCWTTLFRVSPQEANGGHCSLAA